jgi:uncharacterized protein YdhG (YjbR/CyaY superfamily)
MGLKGYRRASTNVYEGREMNPEILRYNQRQEAGHKVVCNQLAEEIAKALPDADSKIWHAHPVWFLNDNPIVGYSKQKPGIRLMFWSGADFEEAKLNILGEKFKDSSIFLNEAADVPLRDLRRWLKKARSIQWDYKNLVRRKGRLVRLA